MLHLYCTIPHERTHSVTQTIAACNQYIRKIPSYHEHPIISHIISYRPRLHHHNIILFHHPSHLLLYLFIYTLPHTFISELLFLHEDGVVLNRIVPYYTIPYHITSHDTLRQNPELFVDAYRYMDIYNMYIYDMYIYTHIFVNTIMQQPFIYATIIINIRKAPLMMY